VLRAFAESAFSTLDDYYHTLRNSKDGSVALDCLINALTIGETHFFRNDSQFDALFKEVLPQIVRRKRHMKTLRIWSAGCASGEEPYSIAIMLREILHDFDEWAITILGTDINTEVLDRARKATFSEWAFREPRSKQLRPRYFSKQGNRYVLAPEIRKMVSFARLNLVEDIYPAYETNTTFMDLILCRNVTIYFAQAVTQKITERFYESLIDRGWLVIGHSEHSITTYHQFKAHNFPNAILYQKDDLYDFIPEETDERKPFVFDIEPITPPSPKLPPLPTAAEPPKLSQIELPAEDDPIKEAQMLLEYGQAEKACAMLHGLIEGGMKGVDVFLLLGKVYASLGVWDEAEYWCIQATELDKLALEAYYTLSLVLQHQGQIDEALYAMKKVVYIDRHNVLGHFNLANLYHSNDQIPPAHKSLENAIRLLDGRDQDDLIEGSGGITVSRLRDAIIQQQQLWNMELISRNGNEGN
jgi:chemotaxis protein methyltransferase CheR